MKVMMLAPGNSIHSKRSLSWLLERGCSVLFLDEQDPKPEDPEHFQYVPYPQVHRAEKRLYKLLGWKWSLRMEKWATEMRLRRIRRRFRPDVVHVHWIDHRAHACFCAGLRPLILSVWGSDINNLLLPDADPQHVRSVGDALAGADQVLADAPDMQDKCSQLAGRPVKVEMLPYGIDTQKFRPGLDDAAKSWRQDLGVPEGVKVLLSMRLFFHRYGHHLILEAFAQALGRFHSQSILVFKTTNSGMSPYDTEYEAEVRTRAGDLGISHLIRFAGDVPYEQMPEIYAFADAIVNYPCRDAFPVTFLEAAASEKPVITIGLSSYRGTFAERFFRMVEPGRIDELADAMVEFVNEPASRRAESLTEARRIVEREYDETVVVDRLLRMYKRFCTPTTAGAVGL
jgi:glycosyltransferase involved in cell wall biosynthesis